MSICERLDETGSAQAVARSSVLEPCVGLYGDLQIREDAPRIREIAKGVYVPLVGWFTDAPWGLYDMDGGLVEEAAYKRGPGRILVGQPERLEVSADLDVVHEEMIYGGAMQAHFGHFLTAMLPRYWIDFAAHPDRKILVHSGVDLEAMFAIGFIREIFGALGLERSRFVTLDRPSVIDRLIVPEPLFQEQSSGHPLFARLCESIHARLNIPGSRTKGAVYLSKEKLTRGIWRVVNESRISAVLAAKGVDIVYPEALPLREQMALFERYETICGLMGSALHTSLFSRLGNRIVGLNHNTFVVSNHAIIDRLNGNDAVYVHPSDGMTLLGKQDGFQSLYECPSPERVGEELLAML